jgi:Tol biopolymer transport system component
MGGQRITIEDLLAFRWIADAQVSPNGRTVAYTEEVIGQNAGGDGPSHTYRSALWLVDTDAGAPRQFTTGEARDRHPTWSPDGTQILFTSDRGTPAGAKTPRPKHLWVIASHGGEARRLTRAEHQPADAAWSPDGTQVAFTGKAPPGAPPASDVRVITRLKYKLDGEGFWDGRYKQILVVPADGGEARQLTSGDFDHREPAWSPDGTRIARCGG